MINLRGLRCTVTGGAGFIGSNLAIALVKAGAKVRILDNLATGRKENLQEFLSEIDFAEVDLRNLDSIRKRLQQVDYVFHQAAINSVPRSVDHPDLAVSSNVMGTLNVLMAAKEAGVKKVVYASSSSVYGGIKEEIKSEAMPPVPISPYAISKYAAELLTQNYTAIFQLPTVSLRYFNVFGPRQNPNSPYAAVIPKFLGALLKKKAPVVFGDGNQARDFTFVENIVEANLLALEFGNPGEVYNIGCGRLASLKELLEELYAITGSRIAPQYTKPRPGDVFRSGADISKARRELSYDPRYILKEGLRRMADWFKENEVLDP